VSEDDDDGGEDGEDEATRAGLRHLAEDGSDLTRPMVVDFFVVVPDEAVGHVVVVRTAPMGFASRLERDDEEDAWTCVCSVTIVPTFERVRALERLLDRLARELGGFADGFGSFGNAPAKR
jgi:hypothetical protein